MTINVVLHVPIQSVNVIRGHEKLNHAVLADPRLELDLVQGHESDITLLGICQGEHLLYLFSRPNQKKVICSDIA